MFTKDTIILPLPKITQNHTLPPIHNTLWDYKFDTNSTTTTTTPSTTNSSPSPILLPIHHHYQPQQQQQHLPSIQPQPIHSIHSTQSKITKPSSSSTTTTTTSSQRKKKQCPECHLWFSNLSTHKSIHLTPEERPYLCKICGRGFARSNDLFRHNKRHWKETGSQQGAFKCPFNSLINGGGDNDTQNQNGHNDHNDHNPCHPTGIFSRCDTYKNHLKALHFEYPQGTKKKDRSNVDGKCKKCGMKFKNVDVWLNDHVGKC